VEPTRKEDRELQTSILAGEMRNAWEAEDRVGQPDHRLPNMRQHHLTHKSPGWYVNYDRIFGRKSDGIEEKEGRS